MGVRRLYATHRTRGKRWEALRLQALRRDDFACVQCGARGRLEVDHVLSVRKRPDLQFDLTNLQCLCPSCHTKKTRVELGQPEMSPDRKAWRAAVAEMSRQPEQRSIKCSIQ